MKLMQVMAGARQGGAEAFFERLVVALSDSGCDQTVVIRKDAARARRLRGQGIEPVELAFAGWFDFATRHQLARLARERRPDIVMTWMNRASAKMPKGAYVRCARLGGYYDLKHYRDCDHLIGNTPDIVEYLVRQGWPEVRAHYLPNFVDETTAEPAVRAHFDTPEDVPLIFAMGRLHTNKAFDVLIDAMTAVPTAHLWIAGDGPERPKLEARANAAGLAERARFLGWRDDTPALLAAADLFVCPSRHEPLGNVVLEAWAQGVPVAATASQGPGMLIADDETGLLAPVDDAAVLGRQIARLVSDPALRQRLGAAGLEALRRDYGRESVVARYLAFFERIGEMR